MSYLRSAISREQKLTRNIMRRVRLIYYWRLCTAPLVLQAVLFAVFLECINLSISIDHVFDNVRHLSYMSESISYMWKAAMHTKISVQVILLSCFVLAAVIAKQVVNSIISFIQNSRLHSADGFVR